MKKEDRSRINDLSDEMKKEAFDAINAYYNDYYTGAKILDSSFDEGILKIDLENRTVTLSYDFESKLVEEKDRSKRKSNLKEDNYEQISLFDLPKKKSDPASDKWKDGMMVINICNQKEYTVKKDEGNIIEVFDKEYGYIVMARSDLRLQV